MCRHVKLRFIHRPWLKKFERLYLDKREKKKGHNEGMECKNRRCAKTLAKHVGKLNSY